MVVYAKPVVIFRFVVASRGHYPCCLAMNAARLVSRLQWPRCDLDFPEGSPLWNSLVGADRRGTRLPDRETELGCGDVQSPCFSTPTGVAAVQFDLVLPTALYGHLPDFTTSQIHNRATSPATPFGQPGETSIAET